MGSAPSAAFHRRLWTIVVLGLVVRIGVMAYADQRAAFDFPDSHRYVQVARHIAEGRGPIDSPEVRAGTDPVYPLLISIAQLAGAGRDAELYRWARALNVCFSLGSIWLVGAIGRRLSGDRVGLMASAIFALDPITVFFSALVLTETCFTTLMLSSLWLIVQSRTEVSKAARWVQIAGAGLALGLATMTRSSSLLLIVPLVALVYAGSNEGRVAAALILLLSFAAALSPTLARNYRLFGAVVPVRTGNGASLMEALGPWADGGPGMNRIQYPRFPSGADELEKDRRCRQEALAWARAHPAKTAALVWTKFKRTWSVTLNAADYSSRPLNLVSVASVLPIYLLATIGVWKLRGRPWVIAFLLTPAIYFSIVHCVFVGSIRYRVPAMSLVFVLAAIGLDSFRRDSIPPAKSDILVAPR